MPGGTNIFVVTWALEDVDTETGLPLGDAEPFHTSTVSPVEAAIDVPYTISLPGLTSEEMDFRVTAHVTDSLADISTAPTGVAPEDLSDFIGLAIGSWIDGVDISIHSEASGE